MNCTSCKYPDTRVVETNHSKHDDMILRRRECLRCGMRFTTQEHLREAKQRTKDKSR